MTEYLEMGKRRFFFLQVFTLFSLLFVTSCILGWSYSGGGNYLYHEVPERREWRKEALFKYFFTFALLGT
jgi:hypothetical protein